jgi:outer membrane protein TolC
VVAIAEYSFVNGEASLLELLDAQRGLLAARMDEVEARARLASSTLEIERLLGGKPIQERTDEPR